MKYWIPEDNIEKLEKKLDTVAKKCKKYGCDFNYERVGEEVRSVKVGEDEETEMVNIKFIEVEVGGVAKINDWEFVASLEHTEHGNIIKGVGNYEVPERYYDCKPYCEHCKTIRYRKDTYIIRNSVTGEFKQVGRSCLKDFTSGMDAEYVAMILQYLQDIEESAVVGNGINWTRYLKLREVIAVFAEHIRCFGYAKSDYAGDPNSTKVRGSMFYEYFYGQLIGKNVRKNVEREIEDSGFNLENSAEKIDRVIEFAKNHDAENNYWHNVQVVFNGEYCKYSDFGLIGSAIFMYDKEVEKIERERKYEESKQVERENSEWIGKIGDKVEIDVDIVRCVTSWETMYGITHIWKIVDKSGNVITWKSGNILESDVSKIRGTIRDLNEYRGVKQTEITRVRVIEHKEDEETIDEEKQAEVEKMWSEAMAMV